MYKFSILLMIIALSGCFSESYGDKMIGQGKETRKLGEKWNEGNAKIKKGQEKIKKGEELIDQGRKLMEEGNQMKDESNEVFMSQH